MAFEAILHSVDIHVKDTAHVGGIDKDIEEKRIQFFIAYKFYDIKLRTNRQGSLGCRWGKHSKIRAHQGHQLGLLQDTTRKISC